MNRKAYKITVARSHVKWFREKSCYFMVDSDGPNRKTIFEYSLETRRLQPLRADSFCFADSACAAVVDGRVYAIPKPVGGETHDFKMLSCLSDADK